MLAVFGRSLWLPFDDILLMPLLRCGESLQFEATEGLLQAGAKVMSKPKLCLFCRTHGKLYWENYQTTPQQALSSSSSTSKASNPSSTSNTSTSKLSSTSKHLQNQQHTHQQSQQAPPAQHHYPWEAIFGNWCLSRQADTQSGKWEDPWDH